MNKDLIAKVEKWVSDTYANADHLLRTGYWIKKLDPNASDAMYIAAITHDIERAFKEDRDPPQGDTDGPMWDDSVYNIWHGERSGKFVSKFLMENGADEKLVAEVSVLIKHHEDGGFPEADTLKDADSLSFLEINVPMFISRIGKDLEAFKSLTQKEVGGKFDYMYGRISGDKAKELAKPLYEKAIEELGKVKV